MTLIDRAELEEALRRDGDFLPECDGCNACSPEDCHDCNMDYVRVVLDRLNTRWVCPGCGKILQPGDPKCGCAETIATSHTAPVELKTEVNGEAKNHIEDIVKMLGLELLEEFRPDGSEHTYRFTQTGLELFNSDMNVWEQSVGKTLGEILTGQKKVIRSPFIPRKGIHYYSVLSDGNIVEVIASGGVDDAEAFAFGNCFTSPERADAHKDDVLKWYHSIMNDEVCAS